MNTDPNATGSHFGEKPHFDDLYQAEQTYFWFRHRRRVLAQQLARLTADLADGFQVLEVGCGNGSLLQVLEQACPRGQVTGSDLFAEGLEYARQRVRCQLVQADVYDLPFGPQFDVIGMFDVLEHLPDEQGALRCLTGVLRPGGRLLLTVPAYQSLWSYADEAGGHYRRYAPRQLHAALEAAGYEVDYLTPFMALLYPLMKLGRAAAAWRNRFRSKPLDGITLNLNEFRVSPLVNAALSGMLRLELPLLARGARLPTGTSLLAVARPRQAATRRAA
ncbi:MAG: class I SAM-dependent methyltransferase [Gemmataceae bacterium]